MRKLVFTLSASAAVALGAVASLPAVAEASPAAQTQLRAPSDTGSAGKASAVDPTLSFTTKMLSFAATDVPPQGLSAGDGYVIASAVTQDGTSDGLATAQCTFTSTNGPVLRICTIDYALGSGLLVTSGYINGPGQGAPVALVITGGTGAFANVRGYGTLQPTSTGSDVTLHLYG
jgi:hypothetical protein